MKLTTFDLTGKTVLVIGGTSGIGRTLALEYARWGANVVAVGRNAEKCAGVYKEITGIGVKSMNAPTDATSMNALENLKAAVCKEFTNIDVLVNSAGINIRHNVEDFPMEDYDKVLDTNARSVFMSCQIFGRRMIEQGYGKIVNISSMGAYFGLNRVVPYCASKGAVMQMTKGFAVEWAKYGIQVNCVAPGYFKTELTSGMHKDPEAEQRVLNRNPMKRWGDMQELCGAAIFLSTDASSFVTGITVPVDGGMLALGV